MPLDRLSNPNAPTVAELESAATPSFCWVDPVAEAAAFDEAARRVCEFINGATDRVIRQLLGELASNVDPDLSAWENEGGAL